MAVFRRPAADGKAEAGSAAQGAAATAAGPDAGPTVRPAGARRTRRRATAAVRPRRRSDHHPAAVARGRAQGLAARPDRHAAAERFDLAQGRPDRRPRADEIPRDGRSDFAADRAAVAGRQPASVLRRVRLGRRRGRAGEGARQQHRLDAAGRRRARRRQAGHADLEQRRRAGIPPHHLDRRQVPAHGREPGRQQGHDGRRALSVRTDPPPRHPGDGGLLHPARGPDRHARRQRAAGVHLQGDRRQEERLVQGHQRLARHHRQILGGDADPRHQGARSRRSSPSARPARRRPTRPTISARRRPSRPARPARPMRGCSPAPRRSRSSTATRSSSASTASTS